MNDVFKLIGRKFTYSGIDGVHTVVKVEHAYEHMYRLEDEQGAFWQYSIENNVHDSDFHFESATVEAAELIERIKNAYQVPEGVGHSETHISTLLIDIVKFVVKNNE